MKKLRSIISIALAVLMACTVLSVSVFAASDDDGMNMFEHSDFIEKEQPELDEETKRLISLYQREPSDENYEILRAAVIRNYDAVLVRKEAKLAELKAETQGKPGGDAKVAEMQEIVDEMYLTYWDRINSTMLRFTDERLLKWKIADAPMYEYIPVMGAGIDIYVSRTQVTNEQYKAFVDATGHQAPSNWVNGTYPAGEENYPVNVVSAADAEAYCSWLTANDAENLYRLPTESEWELAAGHMPKDADFNCGVNDGRTPVEQYAKVTRGAHGAVDFWGNVWEWTSTERNNNGTAVTLGVKGGAWNTARTDCRTEYRDEGRDASLGYEDVGFRVIQVLGGKEDQTPEEIPVFTPELFETIIGKAEATVGTKIVVRIRVSLDVAAVLVNGKEAELLRISEKKGQSTFKAVIVPDEAGICEIVITVYDKDGNASAPTSNSVTVIPKKSGK
mgnify:FL=1